MITVTDTAAAQIGKPGGLGADFHSSFGWCGARCGISTTSFDFHQTQPTGTERLK